MAMRETAELVRRWPAVRRGALVAALLALAALGIISACQLVGGYQPFSGHPCEVLPTSKVDEARITTLVLTKLPSGSCYWIDQTEVTVAQYAQFVAYGKTHPMVYDQTRCGWKTAPSDPANETDDAGCAATTAMESAPWLASKPIRCVDWCDAKAFCNWAGMDLCGSETNNPGQIEPRNTNDEWAAACSVGGASYPSGDNPIPGQCNVGLSADAGECYAKLDMFYCGATDVMSSRFPDCKGPSGAFDLIGNVAEWVVLCQASASGGGAAGPDASCQHRGGSFAGNLDLETCYRAVNEPRSTRDRGLGFRCCSGLSALEETATHNAVSY